MRQTEPDVSSTLRQVAEAYLKRPLTPEEEKELQVFLKSAADTSTANKAGTTSSDPAEHARAQAAQALKEGQMRADSAVRDILHNIQGTTTQALLAHEREEQAILKVVQAARTLADLRPSALGTADRNAPPGSRMALSQIADRLANLVKTEVEQNFRQTFGRLQQQMESAIGELHAARQAAQEPAAVNPSNATLQSSNPEPQGA